MALKGVRVLDLSRLLPGPYATLLLADLGAEVIKVEDPTKGDYGRFMGVAFDKNTVSFHALNRGKKSVALDLKNENHLEQFFMLLNTADVLVESFRPGVLEKLLKKNVEELQRQFPSLIICRISGYGQTGPLRLRAGHDVNYLSRTGVLGIMEKPHLLPVQVADVAGGSWPAAFQIVSALYQKQNTGKGCVIDVAMADCAQAMTLMPQSTYALNGVPYGNGNDILNGLYPCYRIYECKEGTYISCGALEPQFWRRFCQGLGRKDLIRKQMMKKAIPEVAAVLKQKTAKEWMKILDKLDCCVEEVVSPEAGLLDPQVLSRNLTVTINNGKGKSAKILKTPLRMYPGLVENESLCSDLGADTESVLRSKL